MDKHSKAGRLTRLPDCLLGVVPQPTDSRLSETSVVEAMSLTGVNLSAASAMSAAISWSLGN